jgi:hypothetical protein
MLAHDHGLSTYRSCIQEVGGEENLTFRINDNYSEPAGQR